LSKARSGRFITIEGGEGVGKSLFQERLASRLGGRLGGRRLLTTREPGGTPAADKIRALLAAPPADDPLLIETEAFLVSAARAQHVGRLIRPALKRGDWVLCDRFADSTRLYQGLLGGLPEALVETLIATSTQDLRPDLTFLLDCDVAVSLSRINGRSDPGRDPVKRYDDAKQAFHARLRQGYLDLLTRFPGRIVKLDAALPPEQVVAQACAAIETRFGDELP
jgi:dTMP kinase